MSEMLQTAHEDLIGQLRPDAQHIVHLGSGDFNDVVRVDDEVFRFPKTKRGRQVLRYDEAILSKLAGKVTLQIPAVHEIAEDGSYAVLSYVPGQIRSSEEIIAFTTDQKRGMARNIATTMCEISSAFRVEEVLQLQKRYVPWQESEDAYYENSLQQGTDTNYHEAYVAYYEKFMRRRNEVGAPKQLVIYGDYHYGNMLFNEQNELSGLVDFSDLGVGSVVSDLRQLYRLGQDVVDEIVADLHGELGQVDMELVRLQAVLHELTVLLRPESQPPHVSPRAELAKALLSEWLGENWETNV